MPRWCCSALDDQHEARIESQAQQIEQRGAIRAGGIQPIVAADGKCELFATGA